MRNATPAATEIVPVHVAGGPIPVAGSQISEMAQLVSGGAAVPDQSVILFVKRYGSSSYSVAGTGVTDVNGTVQVSVRLYHDARVQWRYAGSADPAYAPSTSESWVEPISTRVSATVRADGTYRLVYRFRTTGKKHVFVQVAPGGGNVTGWSRDLTLRVH